MQVGLHENIFSSSCSRAGALLSSRESSFFGLALGITVVVGLSHQRLRRVAEKEAVVLRDFSVR